MYWIDVITKIFFLILLIYIFASWNESFKALLIGSWSFITQPYYINYSH